MEERSWRETILGVILDQGGELSMDSLHEGTETEDGLEEALAAADQLVEDGLLSLDEKHDVYAEAPGMHGAVVAERNALRRGGGPAPARVPGNMKKVITKGGRVFEGNIVVDDPAFVDVVWTEVEPGGVSLNLQARIPREAIERVDGDDAGA